MLAIYILVSAQATRVTQERSLSNDDLNFPLTNGVEFDVGSCLAPNVFFLVREFSSLHKHHQLQIPIRPG